ncbi:hypothetical protein NPIL_252891 [Nephila pilipes]|uniref:Uncharacterized protein n=1 Tax=Nephila pilipes TaxID=299642 RepID=A0A8X6QVC7_NEPPI|nr:hypothetical protein NPIL_252891 [Nephila pilipes]
MSGLRFNSATNCSSFYQQRVFQAVGHWNLVSNFSWLPDWPARPEQNLATACKTSIWRRAEIFFPFFQELREQNSFSLMVGCRGTVLKILFILLLQVGLSTQTGKNLDFF